MIWTCISNSHVVELINSRITAGRDSHGRALEKLVLRFVIFFSLQPEDLEDCLLVSLDRLLQYIHMQVLELPIHVVFLSRICEVVCNWWCLRSKRDIDNGR